MSSNLILHDSKPCVRDSDCSLYEVCKFGKCKKKSLGDRCLNKQGFNFCNYNNTSTDLLCDENTNRCKDPRITGGITSGGGISTNCSSDLDCGASDYCHISGISLPREGLGMSCSKLFSLNLVDRNIYGNCRHPYICYQYSGNYQCRLPCHGDQDCKIIGKHSTCSIQTTLFSQMPYAGFCTEYPYDNCTVVQTPDPCWNNRSIRSCIHDEDCHETDEICKNQRCVKLIEGDRCVPGKFDCPSSMICDATYGRCKTSSSLSSLLRGGRWSNPYPTTCASENECLFNQDCVNGKCVQKGNEGDDCTVVLCNDPFVCHNGTCSYPFVKDINECPSLYHEGPVADVMDPVDSPYTGICIHSSTDNSPPTMSSENSKKNGLTIGMIALGLFIVIVLTIFGIILFKKRKAKRPSSSSSKKGGRRPQANTSLSNGQVLQSASLHSNANNNHSHHSEDLPPWIPSAPQRYTMDENSLRKSQDQYHGKLYPSLNHQDNYPSNQYTSPLPTHSTISTSVLSTKSSPSIQPYFPYRNDPSSTNPSSYYYSNNASHTPSAPTAPSSSFSYPNIPSSPYPSDLSDSSLPPYKK